ncbi:MAG: DUF4270 family protein [Gracilimonas sp.]|uniref:DUF4270 family protein n=1 Tax=Gracilimonas TaxID=649462 RepID=UPI001B2DE488|nr:DUF4270 family protein [Gracilimonas sp.]MBO6584918.1 DUF4270 family protein [Gracilimonas sp.]MBO6615811.1 DUF4270 family protein [Gracilimonas sp.]
MSRTNKGFFSLCISLLTLVIIFNGCEDPGSVGSEFVERPSLTFDTLSISQTEALSYNAYSGRLSFIPVGKYSDQLFGEVDVLSLVQPSINPSVDDSIEVDENFQLKMRIQLDSLPHYGDTLSQSNFNLYEITSNWRGRSIRIDDEIQYSNQVGSFTVGDEKNIIVDLSQDWVDRYKNFYFNESASSDSLYANQMKGLALVADQNNSRISIARTGSFNFIIVNGVQSDTTDTVTVPLMDWGFTMERTGAVNSPNTFPLHSTLEGLMKITMPNDVLKEESQSENIIRADLVFYEAEDEMSQSLPANHNRPPVDFLNLYIEPDVEPVYEYQFGATIGGSDSDVGDGVFKINVTNYVNSVLFGDQSEDKLVIGTRNTAAQLRSTLIYDFTAPENLRPKLIITSLADQQ